MAYKVGAGSVCQAGKQTVFGTSVVPTALINMTSESINTTVNKGDEGNLLASKTANQRDLLGITVDGSISTVLRPEFADFLFEVGMGNKSGESGAYSYTLANTGADLPVSTFVISRGGIVKTYPDVTIRSMSIQAAAQDYVKVDLDVVGTKEIAVGGTGAQTIQNLSYVLPSYRCIAASLFYGAAGSEPTSTKLCVESTTINIDNGIEDAPSTYCSGLYAGQPVKGQRTVTVDFSIPYSDAMDTFKETYYLAQSAPYVALKLEFTTTDEDEKIEIVLPNVCITDATNNVGGTGLIEASFSGQAISVGSAEPITVTVTHNN